MTLTISTTDTSIDLARHATSGDVYALLYASVWNDADECVGVAITDVCGPVQAADYAELPERADEARGWLRDQPFNWSREDADWANEQNWTHIASTI